MFLERKIKANGNKEEIERALPIFLKSIPISGKNALELSNDEKKIVDNSRCTL